MPHVFFERLERRSSTQSMVSSLPSFNWQGFTQGNGIGIAQGTSGYISQGYPIYPMVVISILPLGYPNPMSPQVTKAYSIPNISSIMPIIFPITPIIPTKPPMIISIMAPSTRPPRTTIISIFAPPTIFKLPKNIDIYPILPIIEPTRYIYSIFAPSTFQMPSFLSLPSAWSGNQSGGYGGGFGGTTGVSQGLGIMTNTYGSPYGQPHIYSIFAAY